MKEFLTAVCSYIGAQGYGTVGPEPAADVFGIVAEDLPEKPARCIAVVPTGGTKRRGDPVRHRTFQVLVRAPRSAQALDQAMTVASSIYALFDNKWCVLAPTFYGRMLAEHEAGPHALDQNNHPVYSNNYSFTSL